MFVDNNKLKMYNSYMKNNILIGGDLVPCCGALRHFELGDVDAILGKELADIWDDANHRFFNLECPLTNSEKKIVKCGPHLKCSPKAINGIKKMFPSCVFLSNNHIMDYSTGGLNDTIKLLEKNSIKWMGVGDNINLVKKAFVFRCNDRKIGIYNCCEHEFTIASDNMPGANPYDEFNIDEDLIDLKDKCEYLIVIYHGGKEYYRYPSPQLQKRCHKMVKLGADLIICQHSHCVGCEEKYNGSTIVYGQGNFVFNRQQDEYWDNSLLIGIECSNLIRFNYIPIVQTVDGARLANKEESKSIIDDFRRRSEEIKSNDFVKSEYKKYADERINSYFVMMKRNYLTRAIRKFFPKLLTKFLFECESTLNVVECEAHRELFIQGLKNVIENEKNK